MLLVIALASLAQPQATASLSTQPRVNYLILADELRRPRVQRLMSDLAAQGVEYSADEESGLYYGSCVEAWRGNRIQAEDCIRSRLPDRRQAPLVVLNTYHREARQDVTVIFCVGRGGSGRAVLRQRASSEDAGALRRCIEGALRNSETASQRRYNVNYIREFEFQDVAEARTNAASILRIAVDHVGIPRGNIGSCLVQGRVTGAVKGAGMTPGGRIDVSVPCGSLPARGSRRLHMGDLHEGTFANVYLSRRNTLLDYEPLPTTPPRP